MSADNDFARIDITTGRIILMQASQNGMHAAERAGLPNAASSKNGSDRTHRLSVADEIVAELVQRSAEANTALLRGDTGGYRALNPHADDYTLMSPFGGSPSRGSDLTEERWEEIGRFFRNGTFEQQLVQSYASADMVVLAVIERCHVEVGGLPAQDWPLRVTLVYRREGSEWRLAHRHADPLGKGISVEQAAALARGDAR
jgi:ketosteroid isomerase-like protein